MEYKFLLLLCLLPIVTTQTVEDILQSIEELANLEAKYQMPESYNEFQYTPSYYAGKYGTYDFIIIGAGTAGTVLANRLSEVPNWKILLLEAGQNETLYSDIPAMVGLLQLTDFNWGYKTVPQKGCCLGMNNNQCFIPRGKALGGSSTINFMMYTRGSHADYDNWAANGNPGWSYKEVLPYFLKSENSSMTENYDAAYHSRKGKLHVEHVRHFVSLSDAFLEGVKELDRDILDYNGRSEMGYSRLQMNTINGKRCSGNKAYLTPALNRPNLKVIKGAFVTKLQLDQKDGNKVWAVEFLLKDKKYYATTRMEVILAAGAISSPQILMHSGIGPSRHLQSLGIKVLVDLPVGQNLHDHPLFLFPMKTSFGDPGIKPMDQMVADYLKGFGYLTAAANIQTIGYIDTENEYSSDPNIEQILIPFLDGKDDLFLKIMNFKNESYKALFQFQEKTQFLTLLVLVLLHPKSRGSVKLKSNNIFDHPLIDLNYFSDPDDVEVIIKGLKDFLTIMETEAMQKFNISVPYNPTPGCPQDYFSDDYLRCLVRHVSTTIYHQAGTCKMGPESDKQSVVDHKLKVRGVNNLRVIDASVIPFPLAGHNNAPTYMIAEKGSDIIKNDWHYPFSK